MTIHGGSAIGHFAATGPNLVVPLDVLREMNGEGVIGELAIPLPLPLPELYDAKGIRRTFVKTAG